MLIIITLATGERTEVEKSMDDERHLFILNLMELFGLNLSPRLFCRLVDNTDKETLIIVENKKININLFHSATVHK